MLSNKIRGGHALRTAVGITILALLLAGSTSAATITVPDNSTKIQWAIDNATAGDTIEVHSGTYFENVNVSKQLTLRGIGQPVVDANGSGSAITLAVDGIILEGFTATGAGFYSEAGIKVTSNNNTLIGNNASISLSSSNNNTLIGNNASNNGFGIHLESSNNNTLSGNSVSNNCGSTGFPCGIVLTGNNNTLIGNNASNNHGYYGYGISLSGSNNKLIGNNANSNDGKFTGGISLSGNNNTLIGNNVSNNYGGGNFPGSGIGLSGNNNTLIGSNVSNNHVGISMFGNNNTLIGNNVSNNGYYVSIAPGSYGSGISLSSSSNNTLIGNNVSNNGCISHCGNYGSGSGIALSSSSNNVIYNNTFNNTNNFYFSESNINNWNITKQSGTNIIGGSYLGGNFWATPQGTGFSQTCSDMNSDGICDEPYVLEANNTDYLPLSHKLTSISFTNPTPANGANINQNYALLNTTVTDSSTAFIDWNRSLEGWWRFNNESGENPSFFRDWSSLGNNATCSGVNCPSFTSGKFGNALNFDGINDYVDAGSGASLDITDAITIETWINPAVAVPTLKGSYDTAGWSYEVAVAGNYAYVADGYNGLVIVDVTNPAAPTFKGSYQPAVTAGYSYGVAVAGNFAYVADGSDGLVIVDVTNPAAPTLKGRYDTAGYSQGVAVAGNFAYVADGSDGLVIVDVSDPAAPTLKGSYDTAGGSVAVAGNFAYVADGSDGLVIVDVTNPAAPTLKGRYDTAGFSYGVAVAGNYAYVADGSNGLVIVDVSDPAMPTLIGSYSSYPAGYSYGVAVVGYYAYVADASNGLLIFNVANPAVPTLIGSYSSYPAGYSYGVAVVGNYAYMADWDNGLVIVDVTNPAPQEKCWDGASGNYGVMSKVSAPVNSANWSWQLRYGAPGGGCYLGYQFNGNPEGSRWVTVKQNLTAGQWYHVVGTFDGTDIKSYLNGNLTDTNKISAIKGYSNRLLIGNDGWANLFNGKIDDVRIHKRALSPEEIKASYDAGINRLYRNFTNLADGDYNYQAFAQNIAGAVNQTEKRTLSIFKAPTLPVISFIDPTPENGAILNQNPAYINTSVSDASTAFIDWNRSLAGWWRFNGESGENSSYFRDWSSWRNNATCSGPNCPSSTSGKYGNALSFDGVNDYVDTGNGASLDVTGAITIEAWINPAVAQEKCWDGASGNYGVMSKVSAPANSMNWSWQLRYGAPGGDCYLGYQFNGNPEGSRWVTVKQNLTAGQWYHVVGTFDGTDIKSYLDGNLKDTNKISAIKGYRNRLLIGNDGWANLFNGKIDDVRIHKRALSPEEIKASYDAGIYRLYRNFTGLAGGSYNYQAYAQNLAGAVNQTEKRTLTLITSPTIPSISFTNPTPANGVVLTQNYANLNTTVSDASTALFKKKRLDCPA